MGQVVELTDLDAVNEVLNAAYGQMRLNSGIEHPHVWMSSQVHGQIRFDELHGSVRLEVSVDLPGVADTTTDRVSVDLAEVTFLSASGLRTLLLLLCAAHHNGKSFDLHHVQPQVCRVLDLFGFTTFEAGLVWEATMSPKGRRH